MVERLDLTTDQRQLPGQLRDRGHRDAFASQELAGPVGGEDLDLELKQVASEGGDPFSVRH